MHGIAQSEMVSPAFLLPSGLNLSILFFHCLKSSLLGSMFFSFPDGLAIVEGLYNGFTPP